MAKYIRMYTYCLLAQCCGWMFYGPSAIAAIIITILLLNSSGQMNLLNRFQRDVVSYWVRYGHKIVEDIVSATFDLLLLGSNTPEQLCPIHYLSLLDPTSQWTRDWTVSRLRGREGRVGGKERKRGTGVRGGGEGGGWREGDYEEG